MPAVEHVKLRMKIGVHELEAEGPRDVVTTPGSQRAAALVRRLAPSR